MRVEFGRERALLELHIWRLASPGRGVAGVARRRHRSGHAALVRDAGGACADVWREAWRGADGHVAPRDGARPPVRRPRLQPVQ